jgi:sugar-specific transcriptional regulator TrmB
MGSPTAAQDSPRDLDTMALVSTARAERWPPTVTFPSSVRTAGPDAPAREMVPPPAKLLQGLALFGISAREGRLYLALARGGPMNARAATVAAGLQRATAYRILLRLLHRGLIMSDGMWPQRFYALPFGTVYGRMQTFFNDEEEMRHWMASCYGTLPEDPNQPSQPPLVEIVTSRGAGSSTVLQEISRAQRQIDVLIRLRSTSSGFRAEVARTLAQAAAHGVMIRLLTDASPADRQFLNRLYRDFDSASRRLEVRHYSPLVGHLYVLDAARVLRFSALGGFGRATDVGILCSDPSYARAQATRFEELWVEAVPASTAARPMRASGWLSAREPAMVPPHLDPK